MASDQQVSARAILRAESELRRLGHRRVMEQLEQVEPDLSSHVWEQLTAIHQQLLNLGAPAKTTQRVYRQVQALMLIGILSLRQGHYELWKDLVGDDEPPAAAGNINSHGTGTAQRGFLGAALNGNPIWPATTRA